MKAFKKYLGSLDHLVQSSTRYKGKDEYIHPALKNIGSVTLVTLREAIAPVIFRNSEQEITDIEFNNETYIRAVPNKFKYPEKGRGLQILRAYGVGGRLPQNKTVLRKDQKPSDAYDLNTLVFGDSANHDDRILPVRAGVNYSDGLSLLPKHLCVDESFHNRAMEDGTLFDADRQQNSDNLFTRHFILPGTLMVQVLSTRGRVLPPEGMDHLLLSMGIAGLYGGQTAVTGVNLRTHLVGMYGASFERSLASPYEIIKNLDVNQDRKDLKVIIRTIHDMMADVHETAMGPEALSAYQKKLVDAFEAESAVLADPKKKIVDALKGESKDLKDQYERAAVKVGELFDSWFGTGKSK